MKEYIWLVIAIVILMIMIVAGPFIWFRNYKECRTQFSVMYCATRK